MKNLTVTLIIFTILCITVHYSSATASNNKALQCSGDNWIHYEHSNKCFKLIKQYVSQKDAKILCKNSVVRSSDPYPPILASIKSEDEQSFISNYLFNMSKVTSGVWIGGERVEKSSSSEENDLATTHFQWSDGSKMEYEHWTSGSPTNEILKGCTELSSRLSHKDVLDGEWIDVACEKPNWVLCEKGQDWSLSDMQHAILQVFKSLEETNLKLQMAQDKLNETENELFGVKLDLQKATEKLSSLEKQSTDSVPIGFIYMQLPDQQEPKQIWPRLIWEDISNSSLLSGNFFRVLGKNAGAFGLVQTENFPRITYVRQGESSEAHSSAKLEYPENSWEKRRSAGWLKTGDITLFGEEIGIDFETAGGEVRPQNVAVKIWKRIA